MLVKRRPPRSHIDFVQLSDAAFAFIRDYLVTSGGVSPTFREINDAIDARSISVVSRILDRLESTGKLRRVNSRARAIEILDKGVPRPRRPDVLIPAAGRPPALVAKLCPAGRVS